jgi:nucleotide-binding universal stress UspA family protein
MSMIQVSAKISAILGNVANQTAQNILVPIDFSPAASVALDYAVAIAKALGSQITVYHSFAPIEDVSLAMGVTMNQETDKIIKELSQQAENLIAPYRTIGYENKSGFVQLNTLVRLGYIDNDIEELTNSSYDLVVLGTKGVTGIDEIMFGSVAGKISEIAKCPVLVIPEKAHFKGIDTIVYATEFDKNDPVIIDGLLEFSECFGASLTCLHINIKSDNVGEELSQLTDLEERYWFTPMQKLRFELQYGESVLTSLYEYLDEHKPDIITVLRKDRTFVENIFHKSISQKLAFHSKIPILILQDRK